MLAVRSASARRGGGFGLPRVMGLRAAVDEAPPPLKEGGFSEGGFSEGGFSEGGGRFESMYYLAAEDVGHLAVTFGEKGEKVPLAVGQGENAEGDSLKPFLSKDHFGCNSLGGPHPFVDSIFKARGLEAPWRTEAVPVVDFKQMLMRATTAGQANARVGVLKVDVEGKDLAVLRSVLAHCAPLDERGSSKLAPAAACPLAIQFEHFAFAGPSSEVAWPRELAAVLARLEAVGYARLLTQGHDAYLSLTRDPTVRGPEDRHGKPTASSAKGVDFEAVSEVFAWSGPLGLVVKGTEACAPIHTSGGDGGGGEGREAEGAVAAPDPRALVMPNDSNDFAAGLPALTCLLRAGVHLPSLAFPLGLLL
mmetsp:Transcript_69875/g.157936  ORF Transcript_69875/g.157936 Transcript_69875/m.157936 type:complete len:363 (+) Transcript_69875:1134-2222(+)